MTPATVAAITMTVAFALLLLAILAVVCRATPRGGWDHTEYHARRNAR